MTDWLGLRDRAALVAGAGGIGAAAALALARQGARVMVADVDEERLAKLTEQAAELGVNLDTRVADLTDAEDARKAVAGAAAALGGLDVFLHAVGMNDRRPALETPDEVWQRIIDVNLKSAVWTAQAAGALMVDAGYGRIVFVSSVSGLLAHAHHAPYAATKGGVNQLCRVMAREWAPHGVTVNAIAPGYTETDLTRAYLDRPGMRESMVGLVPAGRLGTADDLVGPLLFLSSARSAFVTGHVMYVDGGRTLV
ncbi:SDR family oxidoreductase [Streptomyces adustus]|uniref:SDR family oxidoreductase n=1 Tax=Streptomyces adustus TaxID=1609272 RepID=A0A5N8V528_9ACTN|nr:SDR family oxidoreductase [Streptomyces adustus]MPY30381.1 SDR family oxidoreductase [Streptomyces adustus]